MKMKKLLFLCATALLLSACAQKEQKDNKEPQQEPQEQNEVKVPMGVPVAPMQQITVPEKGGNDINVTSNPNGTVLKLEEGKPLDFSQLNGKPTMHDQLIAKIDTIRSRAEQLEDAECMYFYGYCCENGLGVKQDAKQAFEWYTKASKKVFPASYNALGNLYRSGSGVKADATQAFGWYMKGANANDAQAMLNVGNCYFYGMGTEKDEKEAVKWWKDAADAGNAYAQSQMGDCYYFGIGVTKDLKKAIEYYKPAADQNIASAQYRLGLLYYNGEGVEQDRTYAKLLMQKARDGGDKDAQAFLEKNF